MNVQDLPTTIPEYLAHLRRALAGADPAMIQDALYDAEEYLRSELAENPGKTEAEVIASVASSYGAPEEVADIYRDTETTVQAALRPPAPRPRTSATGRFFGVAADPRAYAALFYMALSLATGVFYFTWIATGFSVSLGLSVTIIGVPLLILFFGSVRVLSLVEGRIVEVMLGERMPRRPLYTARGRSIWQRIGDMFTDPRTWSTMLYFLLMLPLGTLYFSVAVVLLVLAATFVLAPIAVWTGLAERWSDASELVVIGVNGVPLTLWEQAVMVWLGIVLVFATLHLARAIGRGHGQLAKHLLVKSASRA